MVRAAEMAATAGICNLAMGLPQELLRIGFFHEKFFR
jgi:hypothetical protein